MILMKIARETDYAIRCVLHLAGRKGEVVMATEISRLHNIPRSFLAKILQKLAKAEILRSFKGAKGGFQFVKQPSEINLLDVIETIQGPLVLSQCAVDDKVCSRRGTCSVHPLWNILVACMVERLRSCSIETLLSDGRRCRG